jgi:hypothetical protein
MMGSLGHGEMPGAADLASPTADSARGVRNLFVLLVLGGNPQLLEAGIEGSEANPKLLGGLPPIAAVGRQRGQDGVTLQVLEGLG